MAERYTAETLPADADERVAGADRRAAEHGGEMMAKRNPETKAEADQIWRDASRDTKAGVEWCFKVAEESMELNRTLYVALEKAGRVIDEFLPGDPAHPEESAAVAAVKVQIRLAIARADGAPAPPEDRP